MLCAAVWALIWAVSPAQATTTVLDTVGQHLFTVPGGVTSIEVVATGAGGGATGVSPTYTGGVGAEVSGSISVTPGDTLYIEVGGEGAEEGDGGSGGFNGGASGGGGGGGASDVRTLPFGAGLEPDDTRLIVAGGGGGAGAVGSTSSGVGGDAGNPGGGSEYSGGGAGTPTEGGEGAAGCFGNLAGDGVLGAGGAGGDAGESTGPGGGGGGGYYGGGGGGGACEFGSSGGGGGSSLMPLGGSVVLAAPAATPLVELTYTLVPPTIAIASPAAGATYTQGQVVNAAYSCTPPAGTTVKTCAGPVASGAALDTTAPGAHSFIVNADDIDGATATKTVNYTVLAAEVKAPPPGLGPADTRLGSHPKKTIKTKKKKVTVRFSFSSSTAGATFKCKLDKGQFAACSSPKSYKVKPGKHTFSVVAVAGGTVDPTPATFSFKVKKTK